jgi:hypothetical protein
MKALGIVAALAVFVAGCTHIGRPTAEQIDAAHDQRCQSWGAKRGSSEYIQCRQTLIQVHQQERSRRAAIAMRLMENDYTPPPAATYQAPIPRAVNCTTIPLGGGMSTTRCN